MAFCAWCGNHVPEVSYAPCARCGNPTNGAQRVAPASTGTATGLIIGLFAGGVVLVAIIGILAAIAIPNLLTATQRAKQKRTVADIRSISGALEAYASEKDHYPAGTTMDDLVPELSPVYMKAVPRLDGWGTSIRYECWPAGACVSYALGSGGRDKTFEHGSLQEYGPETSTTNFDNDLVLSNGKFVQAPGEIQKGPY